MKNLTNLAEKINSEFSDRFPFFTCSASTNISDCVTIRLSLESKENWPNNIFQNSKYAIIFVFTENQREENSNPEKYHTELSSSYKIEKRMRKKTGNLNSIFAHLSKYLNLLLSPRFFAEKVETI